MMMNKKARDSKVAYCAENRLWSTPYRSRAHGDLAYAASFSYRLPIR